ncbi:S8 family serine peptidase [Kitasatospora sp. NPDC057965]|uniref:S8 family serine peptidase n=1 Tax=Kitasatospora sp. NPDC057965 TaxID=3346291 RepID=UPI0036DCD3D6
MSTPTTHEAPQVSPATSASPLGLVILKVAGRCNLDCTYCYEFNLADQTLAAGPKTMSQVVFSATIERIRRHAERSGQRSVTLSFHGGEPCLIGAALFDRWCTEARRELAGLRVRIAMQTNGIAVLDDGTEAGHPEFAGKLGPQYDFASHTADASPKSDFENHGTACAGVATARGLRAAGAAPSAPSCWPGSPTSWARPTRPGCSSGRRTTVPT